MLANAVTEYVGLPCAQYQLSGLTSELEAFHILYNFVSMRVVTARAVQGLIVSIGPGIDSIIHVGIVQEISRSQFSLVIEKKCQHSVNH